MTPARRGPRPVIDCGPEHLDAIRGIYNDAIRNTTALYEYEPRTPQVIQDWYDLRCRERIPILGIEWEPGMLAGFATWGPFRPRPAYKYSVEHSVYVDERYRGRGLGRLLLEAIVERAQQRELHLLVGGIDSTNAASIALHRSLGFEYCGTVRQAGFKFGRWLDLQFWQRILTTPANPIDG